MANTYPSSLNTHKKDWSNTTPVKDTHPEEHNDIAAAVEALEAKVGANGSAVTTSHDYKLSEVTGSDKAVSENSTQTVKNKTISADDNTINGIAANSFVVSNGSGRIDGSAPQKSIPSGDVVGTSDAQDLNAKKISPRVVSTASASSLTPNFANADIYELTALDEASFTLGLPTNLADGAAVVVRIVVADEVTFSPSGDYLFAEDSDAPPSLNDGFIYEFIISQCAGEFLVSWTRYET